MYLIYRQIDSNDGTTIITHNNINRNSEMLKKILSNSKIELLEHVNVLVDDLNKKSQSNKDKFIKGGVHTAELLKNELKSNILNKIKKFLEKSDNQEIITFFDNFDFDNEIIPDKIYEFLFFENDIYIYYRISNNKPWFSFMFKNPSYKLHHFIIVRPSSTVLDD
jgi:hypothetical protein